MSDTMPERVWLSERGRWYDHADSRGEDVVYVPEQRALDAEADHIGASTERDKLADECNKLAAMVDTLRAERDALQADLKALLPWARGAVMRAELKCIVDDDDYEFPPELIAARAILDREGT